MSHPTTTVVDDREKVTRTATEPAAESSHESSPIGVGAMGAGVLRGPEQLTRFDPPSRAAAVGRIQRTAGNAAAQRLLASPMEQSSIIERDADQDMKDAGWAGEKYGEHDAVDESILDQPSGIPVSPLPGASQLQRSPKTNDPFGIGFLPAPPSPPQFLGPLGVMLENVAEASAKPNPADPYEQPPVDWDSAAGPVSAPLEPEPWSPPIVQMASPLPYQRDDGKPSTRGVKPEQYEKATRCESAFASTLTVLEGSWTAASPGITDFNNAARDAAAQGLTTISGEAWDPPADMSQNLSQFADEQQTGPQGQKTAIKDLFKPGGADSQVDFSGVAKGEKLDESLKGALVTAEQNVQKAANGYNEELKHDKTRALDVKTATDNLTLTKEKEAQEDAESAKAGLEKEKKEFDDYVDTAVTVIGDVIDVIGAALKEDPVALAKTGVGEFGILIKMASDTSYDTKLAQASGKIASIKSRVQSLTDVANADQVMKAILEYEAQKLKVDTAVINFKQAISNRKQAYDTFAKAAGAAAGGGDAGAKVEAAIEAIPVIEAVVARIQKVTDVIKLPPYTEDSGIGYRAAGSPLKFITYLAQLKGYNSSFTEQRKTWSDRLKSLQKLATGLFSKPGAPL